MRIVCCEEELLAAVAIAVTVVDDIGKRLLDLWAMLGFFRFFEVGVVLAVVVLAGDDTIILVSRSIKLVLLLWHGMI